jgi:dTDP-4-amino-4,6-dideoxygalactose transaminase
VIGYNYRLSNLLAAVGRAQLRALDSRIEARRRVFQRYHGALAGLPGIEFMPEAAYGRCTRWLTCLTVDPAAFGATRDDIRLALEALDIEARPVWKPMHLQPVFAGFRARTRGVAERLFALGLCLPSGSALTDSDIDRVVDVLTSIHRRRTGAHTC